VVVFDLIPPSIRWLDTKRLQENSTFHGYIASNTNNTPFKRALDISRRISLCSFTPTPADPLLVRETHRCPNGITYIRSRQSIHQHNARARHPDPGHSYRHHDRIITGIQYYSSDGGGATKSYVTDSYMACRVPGTGGRSHAEDPIRGRSMMEQRGNKNHEKNWKLVHSRGQVCCVLHSSR
jgi:hypothetical protein